MTVVFISGDMLLSNYGKLLKKNITVCQVYLFWRSGSPNFGIREMENLLLNFQLGGAGEI